LFIQYSGLSGHLRNKRVYRLDGVGREPMEPAALNRAMRNALLGLLCGLFLLGGVAMATKEPAFVVALQEDEFEVRDCPALIATEVSVTVMTCLLM
jgi:hypothetical protein